MHFFTSVTALAALATFSQAAPVRSTKSTPAKRSFIVPRSRLAAYSHRTAHDEKVRALNKFGSAHSSLSNDTAPATSGTVIVISSGGDSSSLLIPSDTSPETGDGSLILLSSTLSIPPATTLNPAVSSSSVDQPQTTILQTAEPVSQSSTTTSQAVQPVSSTTQAAESSVEQPSTTSTQPAEPATTTSQSSASSATSTATSDAATVDAGDADVAADPAPGAYFFTSEITIGGQKLNLNFDTGSSDLWVYAPNVSPSNVAFDSSKSSNWEAIDGASWNISYGDGSSAAGSVGYDVVTVGEATFEKQAVELAQTVSSTFQFQDSDGILGLGFSNINCVQPTQQKTFFDNIKDQLEEKVMTVSLDAQGNGEYEFGHVNASKYTGDIVYTPVDSSNGYWQIDSPGYAIDGKDAGVANSVQTIVDTGTSLLLVNDQVVQAYYKTVDQAKYDTVDSVWLVPCTATENGMGSNPDLPTFGMAIGSTGKYATIPGDNIAYAFHGDGFCSGAVQSNILQPDMQILGDTFLNSQFVVFDIGAPRLGFATRAE